MREPDPLDVPFAAREGRDEPDDLATSFSCPLCGGRFTHGTLVCGSCPLNAGQIALPAPPPA